MLNHSISVVCPMRSMVNHDQFQTTGICRDMLPLPSSTVFYGRNELFEHAENHATKKKLRWRKSDDWCRNITACLRTQDGYPRIIRIKIVTLPASKPWKWQLGFRLTRSLSLARSIGFIWLSAVLVGFWACSINLIFIHLFVIRGDLFAKADVAMRWQHHASTVIQHAKSVKHDDNSSLTMASACQSVD